MKRSCKFFLVIAILFSFERQALAQNTPLNFTNQGKPFVFGIDTFYSSKIHEIIVNPDSTFEFWSRPHISCLTWHQYKGTWQKEGDTLFFSDNYELVENQKKETVHRTIKGVTQNKTLVIISTTKTKTSLPDYNYIEFEEIYMLNK